MVRGDDDASMRQIEIVAHSIQVRRCRKRLDEREGAEVPHLEDA